MTEVRLEALVKTTATEWRAATRARELLAKLMLHGAQFPKLLGSVERLEQRLVLFDRHLAGRARLQLLDKRQRLRRGSLRGLLRGAPPSPRAVQRRHKALQTAGWPRGLHRLGRAAAHLLLLGKPAFQLVGGAAAALARQLPARGRGGDNVLGGRQAALARRLPATAPGRPLHPMRRCANAEGVRHSRPAASAMHEVVLTLRTCHRQAC